MSFYMIYKSLVPNQHTKLTNDPCEQQQQQSEFQQLLLSNQKNGTFINTTKLHIREGERAREMKILDGQCIILLWEVIHFGASYQRDNRRIFFKAIPAYENLPAQVYKDVGKKYKCPHCPESYDERHLLSYHAKAFNFFLFPFCSHCGFCFVNLHYVLQNI
jgi:hypothetical protein